MVTCYDVRNGQFQWSYSTPVRYESVIADVGPRATPTIDEGMVYTLGATARLLCLDGATGRCVWEKDLWKQYGVTEEDDVGLVIYDNEVSYNDLRGTEYSLILYPDDLYYVNTFSNNKPEVTPPDAARATPRVRFAIRARPRPIAFH